MNSGVIRTGRAVAAAAIVIGLVAGCGSSSDSKPTAAASTPQTGVPALPGVSADCKALLGLVKDTGTAVGTANADKMQQASAAAAKAAAAMSDPKLKDGAMKISQYDQQQAAYAKDPSSKNPDSNLMNAATEDMAACTTGH
jgi:hypothetical protein